MKSLNVLTGYHSIPSPPIGPIPPEPSSSSSKLPPPACAHALSEPGLPSNSCSSAAAEYVFHGPPSTRYCVSTAPEPAAPSCGSSVTRTGPSWPADRSRAATVLGGRPSTRTPSAFGASTLGSAALSVAKYCASCSPGALIVNGPV